MIYPSNAEIDAPGSINESQEENRDVDALFVLNLMP